eukprot:5110362-Alexandrium_andersonii.AAC.1
MRLPAQAVTAQAGRWRWLLRDWATLAGNPPARAIRNPGAMGNRKAVGEQAGFEAVKLLPHLPVSYTHLRAHETSAHL